MANDIDINTLRKEFCPPLDEAIFLALENDYDLHDHEQYQAFVKTLTFLKKSALEQEDTDFDPSGTGGFLNQQFDDASAASKSTPEEGSTSNGVTSITTGFSDLKWNEGDDYGKDLEQMPLESKEEWLKNLFSDMSPHEIKQTLRKSNGALNRAIDELLNISFLQHDDGGGSGAHSPIPKGVDGFAEDAGYVRTRKGRGKRKTNTRDSSTRSSVASFQPDSPSQTPNAWKSAAEDVDFVCARTNLEPRQVKSIYHANGAWLPATIRALVAKETEKASSLNNLDPNTQIQIVDLKMEFPSLSEIQLYGVLTLARNIPSAASELAEVMIRSPPRESLPLGKMNNLAHYAPLNLQDETEPTVSEWQKVQHASTKSFVSDHSYVAGIAFSQAAAAYKRGKSDHLMGGAAAYYSQVGREHLKQAKEHSAAAASAYVSAQSSALVLDLHGVTVADAVRIAKERTEFWWESLGDAKYKPGGGGPVRAGYRIVTGVGRHSKDGAPRLGPAVSKMLIREGWKVEVGQGELMVHGKVRR